MLYNGQHPQLTHALVAAFERQTGIQVRHPDQRRDRARRPDPPGGIALAGRRLPRRELTGARRRSTSTTSSPRLPASILGQVPARYDSPAGTWVGVALRVSSLVYNPSRISAAQLPAAVLDLAQPEWKGKLAVAPTDSDFPPLVGAVIARYGRTPRRRWLAGSSATPRSTRTRRPSSRPSTAADVAGRDQPVLLVPPPARAGRRATRTAGSTTSRTATSASLANISGAAVLASSDKTADAESFRPLPRLAKAQRILAKGDDFEYPLGPGSLPIRLFRRSPGSTRQP